MDLQGIMETENRNLSIERFVYSVYIICIIVIIIIIDIIVIVIIIIHFENNFGIVHIWKSRRGRPRNS